MRKKKKEKITGRKAVKMLQSALLLIGIIAACYIIWQVGAMIIDAYNFDITLYKTDMASTIYAVDQDGNYKEYEQLYSEVRRVWVPIEKIPVHVQKAAVAIEDERFYSHQGVDLKRTLGAFSGFIVGKKDYGGSTITQQLIKNVTNEKDTTAARKMKEIFRALVLETQLEKDEILEYYLNVIYFANSSYGIQTAAQTYFGKDASELDLAEGAAIVGITQAPSYYDPFRNPENNKEKQEIVLNKMLELNLITEEEHREAVNKKLEFSDGSERHDHAGGINSYFAETLVKVLTPQLKEKLNLTDEQVNQMIYTGGLKIYSTLDAHVQESIDKVFEDSDNTKLFPKLAGDVQPQAAVVVISVEDGSVKGLSGGIGKKQGNLVLNRTTDTPRQPGSSIKPLAAYGPAVELGIMEPATVIVDEPFSRGGWSPRNWYKGYKGKVTMQQAVVQSMNIPAIKTVEQVGVENSYRFAKEKLGLSTLVDPDDKNLSALALGGMTRGVTVMDMTAAYNSFAADGIYTEPYLYTKVLDRDGKVLLEHKVEKRQVFSKQTAKTMTSVLKCTAEGSLGISASLSGQVSAGKTGTTNEDKDRWYMGYTPYYTAGVWYGYDIAKTVPYSQTSVVAHRLWKNVMNNIHEPLAAKSFKNLPAPVPDIPPEEFFLCEETGLLAGETCPKKQITAEEAEGLEACNIVHQVQQPSEENQPQPPAENQSDDSAMSRN